MNIPLLTVILSGLCAVGTATRYLQPQGTASSEGQTQTQTRCIGVLDGARFPEAIPDYFAWHQLWKKVAAAPEGSSARDALSAELGLDDARLRIVVGLNPESSADSQAVEGWTNDRQRTPDVIARILAARDEAIRQLPQADFERVQQWVEKNRRRLRYTLPVPGLMKNGRCAVSVKGAEYPELIPESYHWRVYLRVLSGYAEGNTLSDGTLKPAVLRILERETLRIPAEHVQTLFNYARKITQQMDEYEAAFFLRAKEADDSGPHRELALGLWQISLSTRAVLVRLLPESSWAGIQRHVDEICRGSVFDFPTEL